MNDERAPADVTRDDYLWTADGRPDPDVARLEETLRPLAWAGAPPAGVFGVRRRRGLRPALAAAALLLVVAAVVVLLRARAPGGAGAPAWNVATIAGRATIDERRAAATDALAVGQWLATDAATRVRVDVADIGNVTVHPDSRLRLVRTVADEEHRLELARGRIDALIHAPPRLFFVDTPAAVAVDLGCTYTLAVEEDGDGFIDVTMGWVMLERAGLASTVPAGARCPIRAERGPGTPRFADAPPALVTALDRLDDVPDDAAALDALLAAARPRDLLTLWHLIPRIAPAPRRNVIDRMLALSPPPDEITVDAVMQLDADALARWWDDLEHAW